MKPEPDLYHCNYVIDGVYIGGWRCTDESDELWNAGIRHVLKLYEDIPYFPRNFTTLEIAIEDGYFIPKETLKRGVYFIQEQVQAQNPVLVMCAVGMSRSATFVLAYMVERGYTLKDAYTLLRRRRSIVCPHPELWRSLITHYGLDVDVREAVEWTTYAQNT